MKIVQCFILFICVCSILFSCHSEDSRMGNELDSFMNLGDKRESGALVNNTIDNESTLTEVNQQGENSNIETYYGIDISHYQGDILEKISSSDSLRFIICKATEGVSYVDPDFHSNWQTISAKGYIRGAYHFYVCSDDPLKQAAHFVSTIHNIQSADIAPIIDIEQGGMSKSVSGEQMQRDILLFMSRVEVLLKRKPIIYTDYAFAHEYLNHSVFSEYNLWLAEYTNAVRPKLPDLWKAKGILIWQKKDSYDVSTMKIDFDVFKGTLKQLTQ